MSDNTILLQALDKRWRLLNKAWDRTRDEYSDDAVHDLRVASRRLIAVLDILQSLDDDPKIEDFRRRVKKSLGALSPLRDVQVQRASVSKMVRRHPRLKDFQKSLKDREDRIARKVLRLLKKGPRLGGAIAHARRRARDQTDNRPVVGIVDKRYREVARLAKKIDPANSATIHKTRLAFKRFRYTAEVVRSLIGKEMTEARLRELHAFQTMMGGIQDVEVLSARLLKWAVKQDSPMEELKPVFEELERQKQETIRGFMSAAGKVHTFWKTRYA